MLRRLAKDKVNIINGNNGLIVVEERVIIRRKLCADIMYLLGIQPHQRNCETIPHFLLELRHHALYRHDKNAFPLTASNQLAHENACLQRLTKTNRICNQNTLTRSAE